MAVGGGFFAAVVALLALSGVFSPKDPGIQPGELDLSGTWSIRYEDQPGFSAKELDDSGWCRISVPDAYQPPDGAEKNGLSAKNCPTEVYPREKMRNSTYWYRTEVSIREGESWKKPSLFLGGVKSEAWVYWDGELLGSATFDELPSVLLFSEGHLRPGRHTLAIRVASSDESYPGLHHMFGRAVTIGEYAESAKAIRAWDQESYSYTVMFAVQFIALVLVLLLTARSREITAKHLWLSMYFGASTLQAVFDLGTMSQVKLIPGLSAFFMMAGAGGFSLMLSRLPLVLARGARLSLAVILAAGLSGELLAETALLGEPVLLTLRLVVSSTFVCIQLAVLAHYLVKVWRASSNAAGGPQVVEAVTMLALVALSVVNAAATLPSIDIPVGYLAPLLTLAVIVMAIEDHVTQERRLAFFGRFIRKGLKDLLTSEGRRAELGGKVFRGKEVAILRIDIIEHTATTYGMPYGMKRLYQDCWFTTVDRVVADKSFLDKGLGDGSFYYFEIKEGEKTCSAVYAAAIKIRDEVLRQFDEEFHGRLQKLLGEVPELRQPVWEFFAAYQRRTGIRFLDKRTKARFILSAGFVDEGLWGLMSQGHYDVEGDLVTLTARLEKALGDDEIGMNEEFARRLVAEQAISAEAICWRTVELKGIGQHRFAALRSIGRVAEAA